MKLRYGISLVTAILAAFPAYADALRDLSLRIDYAYYSGDTAVLHAAVEELDQLRDRDQGALYLHALAQYRSAVLAPGGPGSIAALESCVADARLVAERDDRNATALALVGACSLRLARAEPLKALLHERRTIRALAAARALAPANPTVAFVEALLHEHAYGRDEDYEAALLRALSLYGEHAARDASQWGKAEAHVALAALRAEDGNLREARDELEAALLAAPGFTAAVRLRERLLSEAR